MSKTPKSDAAAFRVNAYLQAVPLRLSQELENERAACHAAFIFEKDRNIINERENARLREALKWAEPYVPKRADCETRRMIESLLPNVLDEPHGCLAQSLRSRICDKHPCWL